MSPIIKESDGTEQIILDTNNAGTPFPEDINLQANSHQAEALEITETANKSTNDGVKNDKKQNIKNGIYVKRKESFSSVQKDKKNTPQREVLLKRTQSLRTRPSPYDQNNSKISSNQKRITPVGNNDKNITTDKQPKPGKFKIFKNRWSMFQKPSNPERGSQELYNLRRSQSMRIPSKSSQSVNILNPVTENGAKMPQLKIEADKFASKYDIKNSKSLSDIRHLSKKNKSESINNVNAINNNNNHNSNNNNHIRRNLTPISSKLILNENIQTSPSLTSIPTSTTMTTKNFAHKTIDVIRKSVQNKLKSAYLDKQNKKKGSTDNILNKNIAESSKLSKEKDKFVVSSNKEKIKINSKRKEMDLNDCDTEFKPKKKITSLESSKSKTTKVEKSIKANGTTYFKTKDKIVSVENKASKESLNYAKIKNKINTKNHNIALNSGQKDQVVITNSTLPTILTNYSMENNNISSPSQNLFFSSPYTVQNHHVLFLNNIHENLSNNYKRKLEIIPVFDVSFEEPKTPDKQRSRESTPFNFNKPEPSNLRRSLSFDSDKTSSEMTSLNCVNNVLTRSCSETCIDERSLSITNNETFVKSTSPMSISNCDVETVKADDEQSTTSFNCNYDPYIDETMDDFLFEGEEESYFGSLFAESKTTWTNLDENFKLDLDFSGECYYLDNIAFNFENDWNRNRITPSNDFSYNSLSLQLNSSFSLPENSPKSLPSDAEIKIYDSNRNSDLQFCDLVNKNFLTYSHSAIENSGKRETKSAMSSRKPKDTARIKSKINSASEKTKDNANKSVRSALSKESKEKSLSLKKHLTDSKIKRKAPAKSNINQASPSMSPESKIIKLKDTFKKIDSQDAKSSPELMRNKIRRKSLSENSITRKHEGGDSILMKEKVEPEEGKGDTRNKSKTIEPKFAASQHSNKTDDKKNLIETKNLQNKSSAASGVPNTPGVRAAAKDRGPRPLPNRAVSRLSGTLDAPDEKKCQEMLTAASRRSKIDNSKAALAKTFRGTAALRAKQTDPVKILRPTAPNGQTPSPIPSQISEQLKKLEAEISARTQEAQKSREEVARANRGLEALTVLVHYLTNEYNAFSTPKLRAEVERLTSQLTDVRLCLDESSAAARRLELEAAEQCQKHEEVVNNLEEAHRQEVSSITLEHQKKLDEVVEKHNKDLNDAINVEEEKRELLITVHKEQLERIETQWKDELDKQHQRHLQALEQLNACHNEQLRSSEETWKLREQELQESNAKLLKEQNNLKQQAKKLEETLLSDKDHRLQAAKRVCGALQNEVDSLKTVVDMRNSEVHKLRDQLADKERICEELDSARDRVRALQAKAEDLHAQMETKLQLERQLLTDRHSLSESLQREASVNKRLSLENEELQWKLRQRDTTPNSSHSSSSLDLASRCSPGNARQQEGVNNGVLSPQFTPRSQRIGTKPHDKKWSQSFSNIPEDAGKLLRKTELHHGNVMIESPPPSPRVKAVIEKSNSVSFILDLNDTFSNEHFIGAQSYHQLRKSSTSNLQRKPFTKSYSSNLEKSKSTSLVQGSSKTFDVNKSNAAKLNKKEKINGECDSDVCKSENGNHSKYDRTCSTSESSDSGEIERISPTGLSWTVPVHSKRYSKHIPSNRFHLVPETPRLLQQPDEDEYEEAENENEFVEVLALGDDINSAPLTMLFAQTPSTSVSLSDSDVSQCGSRADITSDDDDDDDDDDDGTLLQKESQSRPQEGAGEAMIYSDVFDLKINSGSCKSISKSQISSGPSSDSEDANQATNVDEPLNLSWSEDIECDLTSSSEMQELL